MEIFSQKNIGGAPLRCTGGRRSVSSILIDLGGGVAMRAVLCDWETATKDRARRTAVAIIWTSRPDDKTGLRASIARRRGHGHTVREAPRIPLSVKVRSGKNSRNGTTGTRCGR